MNKKDFTHPGINEEVNSISSHYVMQKETRMPFKDREILYLTGYSVTDSSCCGEGGCAFSLVPGYIKKWQYKKDEDGQPVTEIELIHDEKSRNEIVEIIKEREICTQVNFL